MTKHLTITSLYRTLKADLLRAFSSKSIIIGAISAAAVLFYGYYGMYAPVSFVPTNPISCFINSFVWGNIVYLLFLVAPLAYSASFAEDWQSGFIRPLIMRSDPQTYAISKCITVSISGGSSVTLGAAVFIVFLLIRGAGNGIVCEESAVNTSAFRDLLAAGRPYLFFLCYLLIIYLQAMFWSLVGLLGSAYFPNKYVAYAGAFVMGYLIHQVSTGIGVPRWLNPVQMSTGRMFDCATWITIVWETAFFLLLAGACSLLFIRAVKRRLENA